MLIRPELITQSSLQGVAMILSTGSFAEVNDDYALALWDNINEVQKQLTVLDLGERGGQILGDVYGTRYLSNCPQGCVLHRWLVKDALESAKSVPQNGIANDLIEAISLWISEPNYANLQRVAVIGHVMERNIEGSTDTENAMRSAISAADTVQAASTHCRKHVEDAASHAAHVVSAANRADYLSRLSRSTAAAAAARSRYELLIALREHLPEP